MSKNGNQTASAEPSTLTPDRIISPTSHAKLSFHQICPKMNVIFSILLITTFVPIPVLAKVRTPNTYPSRFLHPKTTTNTTPPPPQRYFEVAQPLPTSTLLPSCSLPLLHYNFSNTYGLPPVTTPYSPPQNCTFLYVTLQFTAFCQGSQYDRIAAVWLGGAELLRTSTAEPTENGVFWKVEKDVTKYMSLLVQESLSLSVMLENIVDEFLTGVYEVNVSFVYYSDYGVAKNKRSRMILENGKSFGGENGIALNKRGQIRNKNKYKHEEIDSSSSSDLGVEKVNKRSRRILENGKSFGEENGIVLNERGQSRNRKKNKHREIGSSSSSAYGVEKGKKRSRRILENGKRFGEENGSVLNKRGQSRNRNKNKNKYRVMGSSSSLDLYVQPADLIIPISGIEEKGFWFRIESELDKKLKRISIPRNSYKAVLELYVSFHGNDEFWYKNPPNSYILANGLITERGNGAYRELFVTIDGKFVGSVVPFPVIFTGGINPLFWEPVVGIGAFDLPSYDIDLTPFLSFLIDGEMHTLGLGVADGISFWLVDANLHLWLDPLSDEVQAGYYENEAPAFEIERAAEFDGLDGEFEVETERTMEFSGWVNSSFGNFTTYVEHELEFESNIEIEKGGDKETIKQQVTDNLEVKVKSSSGSTISKYKMEKEYELKIKTSTVKSPNGTYTMTTSLENSYEEKTGSSTLKNSQTASGWMVVEGNEVLDGEGEMTQEYSYQGNSVCYSRKVSTANGTLLSEKANLLCSSSY